MRSGWRSTEAREETPSNAAALIYDTPFIAKQCIETRAVTNKRRTISPSDGERIRTAGEA